MAKTIKVTTADRVMLVDVDFDDFRSIQKAVGGHFETVHTRRMQEAFDAPMLMLVDEEGLLKGLPINKLGCFFYGTVCHGNPIVGDFILALPVGEDLVPPDDPECLMHSMAKRYCLQEVYDG